MCDVNVAERSYLVVYPHLVVALIAGVERTRCQHIDLVTGDLAICGIVVRGIEFPIVIGSTCP